MFIEELNQLRKDIIKWNRLAKKLKQNPTKITLMADVEESLSKTILSLSKEKKKSAKLSSNKKELQVLLKSLKDDLNFTLKEYNFI